MRRFAVLMLMAVFVWACGSESGTTTGTPDPDEGKTFKGSVTAADGGTVSTDSGSASVEIPKNALDDDTEITVAVEPATGEAQSSIYDFGPDGTTFQTPVTVSIKFDGDPGTDRKAVLAWLNDGVWVEVENSKLETGVVSGKVKHFSKFTVVFVDDKIVLISDCKDAVSGFQPCGGDLKGTWQFKDLCLADDVVLGENPLAEQCPEATLTFEVSMEGTVSFDGTTMTMTPGNTTMSSELTIPDSCLSVEVTCDSVMDFFKEGTCVSAGGFCTCTRSEVNAGGEPDVSTYTVGGTDIVIDEGPDEAPSHVPFCVQGDTVISESEDMFGESTGTVYMILKKQ